MKRILSLILALVLVLACSPNVYATAEGDSKNSSTASNLDPHIEELIKS